MPLNRIDKSARLRVGSSAVEPVWRLGATLRAGDARHEVMDWLFDAGSLTKRLKQASAGRFKVRVLGQQRRRPMRCERRLLGLEDRAQVLIRQVQLLCDGEVVVVARTVLPEPILASRYRYLARLGGKPLGEVLFRDRTMRRSAVQVASVRPAQFSVQADSQAWGRRSLFYLGGLPLLVAEVFVPPLPQLAQHRFRVVRKSGR